MLNTDPKRPLARIVGSIAGLAILGWGLDAVLRRGDLLYRNWFGEFVFAPFAIIFGLVIILQPYSNLKYWENLRLAPSGDSYSTLRSIPHLY
jgi:hypothetical protein